MRPRWLLGLALAACGNTAGPTAAPPQRLGALPLTAVLPAGAGLSSDGDGVIVSARTCVVAIHPVGAADAANAAAFRASAEAGTRFLREELTPSGWLLTYERDGARGRVVNLEVRATLGDREYRCRALAASPLPITCEEQVCRSLAALPAP